MKRLDKVQYKGMRGYIIYKNNNNGKFDISIDSPQVIYENVDKKDIKLL